MAGLAKLWLHAAVREALENSAVSDAQAISIEIDGDEIVLRGAVYSMADLTEAGCAASRACSLVKIRNELTIAFVWEGPCDDVYEAGIESFPASDPPAWASR